MPASTVLGRRTPPPVEGNPCRLGPPSKNGKRVSLGLKKSISEFFNFSLLSPYGISDIDIVITKLVNIF